MRRATLKIERFAPLYRLRLEAVSSILATRDVSTFPSLKGSGRYRPVANASSSTEVYTPNPVFQSSLPTSKATRVREELAIRLLLDGVPAENSTCVSMEQSLSTSSQYRPT